MNAECSSAVLHSAQVGRTRDSGISAESASDSEATQASRTIQPNDWPELESEDLLYLLGPQEYPFACPYCGGRYRCGALCPCETRHGIVEVGFGKHKGRTLDLVPVDYLAWLQDHGPADMQPYVAVEIRRRNRGGRLEYSEPPRAKARREPRRLRQPKAPRDQAKLF